MCYLLGLGVKNWQLPLSLSLDNCWNPATSLLRDKQAHGQPRVGVSADGSS